MKKLILSLAVVAMGFAASAQTGSGTIAIGGNVGFESYTPKGGSGNSAFGLGVNGGYFIQDGMEVMVAIGFEGEDKGLLRTGQKSQMNFGLGVQKYWELGSGFYFTGMAGFDYLSQKNLADVSSSGFGIGVAPGLAWFPADKWGLSMGMGNWLYYNSSDAGSGFGLNPNLGGLSLGVRYFMSK